MSKPKGCTYLTKSQQVSYDKMSLKSFDELTTKEADTFNIYKAKIERFNDPELSQAAKKYLISRYCWEKYNKGTLSIAEKRSSLIKGNELEEDGIKILSKRDKTEYKKASEFVYNEYIFGKCDIFSSKIRKIIDIKVSWGIHGYLPNHITKLSEKYWLQMQGYLDLYGLEYGEVCYVLLNTPLYLIERERATYSEKYMLGEITVEKYEEMMEKLELCYNYNKIPKKRKVITFQVHRDKDVMNMVYKRVLKCREWLNEFDILHTDNKKIITLEEHYGITSKKSHIERDTEQSFENDTGG